MTNLDYTENIVVRMSGVCLNYHSPSGETAAISDLDLTVNDGEFISIVGPSGCGKTSVLSLIAKILKPSSGSVEVYGNRPGYMLQTDHLFDWRTVESNVFLGLEVQKSLTESSKAKARELLKKYGLDKFAKSYPSQLSGGMRQKVALIRTLAMDPKVLLLDEPFSALDYQTRLRLCDEVHSIIKSERKTAVLVTHDIAEAISMSDRIFVFSCRPAHVKSVHIIDHAEYVTPLSRRQSPLFNEYFDMIWRELDEYEN